MNFQFQALKHQQFTQYYGLTDEELASKGVQVYTVDSYPGYPCRVTLKESEVGKRILLLNHEHLSVNSPYRSRHAIFVEDGAQAQNVPINNVPESIKLRQVSIRAFDSNGMMTEADCISGEKVAPLLSSMLSNPEVAYIQVHTAERGCFLAQVERA